MGYLRTNCFTLYAGLQWSSQGMVRIVGDGLAVNEMPEGTTEVMPDGRVRTLDDGLFNQAATLHVVAVDGWEKDSNWGAYLQISCVTQKGKWIDSSDGWVKIVSSRKDPIVFIDRDDYYEIRQRVVDGRPLTVQSNNTLRFAAGAEPGRFNIQDCTHG